MNRHRSTQRIPSAFEFLLVAAALGLVIFLLTPTPSNAHFGSAESQTAFDLPSVDSTEIRDLPRPDPIPDGLKAALQAAIPRFQVTVYDNMSPLPGSTFLPVCIVDRTGYDYDDTPCLFPDNTVCSRFVVVDCAGSCWKSRGRGDGWVLFQGLWHDPVTGLAYARNRWYDPRTAHWLSPDPMGPVDSPNLYAFVGWRPHMARDPRGMATEAGFDWFLATKDLSAEERADYRRGYFEGQLMGARFVAEMGAEELTPAGIANGFSGAFFGYDFIRRERVTGFLGRGSYALAALPFVPTSIRYLDEAAEAADVLRVTRFLDDAPGPGLLDEATVPRTGGINPALQVRRDAYVAWKGRAGIEGTPTSARFRRFMGAHRPGSRGSTLYASRSGFRSPKLGVRNPWGRRGSPAHQARIGQAETRLGTRGWDTFSGGSLPEVKFGARYPDLVMVNDGRRIAIQVGRVTSRGVPVSREFEALADLRATGMFDHVFFLRY